MDASSQTEHVVPFPEYLEPIAVLNEPASSRVSTILEVSEESSYDTTCHTEAEGRSQAPRATMCDSKSTLLRGEGDDTANSQTLDTVDNEFTPTADTATSAQSANMTGDDSLLRSDPNATRNLLLELIAEAQSRNSISTMLKILRAGGTVSVSQAASEESGKWEVHAMIKGSPLVEDIDRSTADKIDTMISRASEVLAQMVIVPDPSDHPAHRSRPMIVLTDPPQRRIGLRCDTGRDVQPESTAPTIPSRLTARDALSRPASPAVRSGASTPTSPGSPLRSFKERMSRLSAASMSENTSRALSRLRGRSPPRSLALALQEASSVAASVGHPVASTATSSPDRDGDRRNSYQGLLTVVRSRRSSMT